MSALQSFDKIDLKRHAMIMASAGTGKTYTVENFVLRLLLTKPDAKHPLAFFQGGRPYELRDLLIVTFTEKATGELKDRIRSKIMQAIDALREGKAPCNSLDEEYPTWKEDRLENNTVLVEHLQKQLQQFDRAQIFTIHGFCNQVLREHAFACGMPNDLEMTDGEEESYRIVRDWLRSDFIDLTNIEQEALLAGGSVEDLVNTLSFLTKQAHSSEIILPQISEDDLKKQAKRIEENFATMPLLSETDIENLLLRKDLLKSGKEGKTQTIKDTAEWPRCSLVKAFLLFNETKTLEGLLTWKQQFWPAKAKGTAFLSAKTVKNLEDNADQEAFLRAYTLFVDVFASLEEYHLQLGQCILRSTALRLHQELQKQKLEKGLMTFDDMIRMVHEAISQKRSPLLDALRQQYKFGIIDEFQDTSMAQWNIFKSIFLDDLNKNPRSPHRLMVVGDPKQSIYGFQGAEVKTCLHALHEIEASGGQKEHLNYNFRSTPEIISAYNKLFLHKLWLGNSWDTETFKSGLEEAYQEVQAGKTESYVPAANIPTAPLWICDLRDSEATTKWGKQRALAQWSLSQIQKLLQTKWDDSHKPVLPEDIAILVEKKKDAEGIISLLRQSGIPTSKVKEDGLFSSSECLHLITALEAVLECKRNSRLRKVAITPFFGINPSSILQMEEEHSTDWQNLTDKILICKSLADHRKWGLFFQEIYGHGEVLAKLPSRRSIAAHKQLRSYAMKLLLEKGMSLLHVCGRLRLLFSEQIRESQEENTFHKETSEPAIQVMTLHTSKGLEFPIVFCLSGASGFWEPPTNRYRSVSTDSGMKWHLDVKNTKADAETFYSEERRRLWYVGLTRAEKILVLPLWGTWGSKEQFPVATSPARSFLDPAILNAITETEDVSKLFHLSSCTEIGSLAYSNSIPEKEKPVFALAKTDLQKDPPRARQWLNTSYSALAHQHAAVQREGTRLPDESFAIVPVESVLPPGAQSGLLLHDILEVTPFSWAQTGSSPQALLDTKAFYIILNKALRKYRLYTDDFQLLEQRQKSIAQMVWGALRTEITCSASGIKFRLCDVERYKPEAEFHFAFDENGKPFPQKEKVKGWTIGFIDLLFCYQERWYILDWKSNSLPLYNSDSIQKSMLDSQYHLQAALYLKAMKQFLAVHQKGFDPDVHLGGALYLYLRGAEDLSCWEQDKNVGVWGASAAELEGYFEEDLIPMYKHLLQSKEVNK